MKKLYSILAGLSLILPAQAQLWSESFSNNCTAGCLATAYTGPNGSWTQTITGTEGSTPNVWFISCAENGNGAGMCGSGCSSTQNPTLHISAAVGNLLCPNDCGASYDAGGLCPALSCPQTSRRIESPTINLGSIITPMAVSFVYIAAGSPPNDQCRLWYYDGTTWTNLQALPATNNAGCGGQGRWTALTVPLPASAQGNPSVKIGFEWVNNDDGAGTDPSFAVDDIAIAATTGISVLSTGVPAVFMGGAHQMNVNLASVPASNTMYEMMDMAGRVVLSGTLQQQNNQISTEGLNTGTYIVRITDQGGMWTTRLTLAE